jgi:hypothetical protein
MTTLLATQRHSKGEQTRAHPYHTCKATTLLSVHTMKIQRKGSPFDLNASTQKTVVFLLLLLCIGGGVQATTWIHREHLHLPKNRLPLLSTATRRSVWNVRGGSGSVVAAAAANVAVDYEHLIEGAYSWCCNLGAPSALVAGAVVATLYDNMHSGDLELADRDSKWVQLGKKLTRLLLLSAFMMETLSIFVTTVTGTMLLSQTVDQMSLSDAFIETPLEFLKEHFEFEFLTARIMFLQGLLNWLAAIALGHLLPSNKEGDVDTPTEIALNRFIACSIGTLIVLMVSFYNNHATFYPNYSTIVARWIYVMMHGRVVGIGTWPPQPLSLVLIPSFAACFYWAYHALWPSETTPSTVQQNRNNRMARISKPRRFI